MRRIKVFFILLGLLHCAHSVCDSGRLFLGSLDNSLSRYFPLIGVYNQEPDDWAGHSVFKHTRQDVYLYYIPAENPDFRGAWAVGDSIGDDTGMYFLSNSPGSRDPTIGRGEWMVRGEGGADDWIEARQLGAHCVASDFSECDTGEVRFHGLSNFASAQSHRMGVYHLQSETHEMRPVYRHTEQDQYLYHMEGFWLVGPEVGVLRGGLLVRDAALRPEFIMRPWTVFAHNRFITDHGLQVSCEDLE